MSAPRLPRLAKIALWTLGGLVFVVAALSGVGLVLMTGQTGRDLVESLADGREAGRYGVIELSSLEGDPLSDLSVGRITLTDADGVWLEIENARLQWRPVALLGGAVEIDRLSAERVRVLRRPVPAPARPGGSGSGPAVRIAELDITALALEEPVVGVAAEYAVLGALLRGSGETSLQAVLDRLDRPGDRIALDARFGEVIQVDASLEAAPDGALAAVLGLAGHQLSGAVDARGGLDAGEGDFVLAIDAAGTLSGDLLWSDGALSVDAVARPETIPPVRQAAPWLGGDHRVALRGPELAARRSETRLRGATLTIEGPAAEAALAFADARSGRLRLEIAPDAAVAMSGGRVAADELVIEGDVSADGAPWFDGEIKAERVSGYEAQAAALAAQLSITGPASAPRARFDLRTLGLSHPALQGRAASLIGDAPGASGEVVFDRDAALIEVDGLDADLAAGRLDAAGRFGLAERRVSVEASMRGLALDSLVEGRPGDADLTVIAEGALDGPIRFDAGAVVRGSLEALGQRIDLSAQGVYDAGTVTLESAAASSDLFAIDGAGRYDAEAWRFSGAGGWSGRAPVAALELEGALDAAFEAAGAGTSLAEARIELAAPGLSAGPIAVAQPRLRAQLGADGRGDWRFTGDGGTGAIDLGGSVLQLDDAVRLEAISGRIGGLDVAGAIDAAADALRIDLAASPQAGFGAVRLAGEAGPDRLDLVLEARELISGDGAALDRLDLIVVGAPHTPRATFEAEGIYNAAFRLSGEASADLSGAAPAGALSLTGRHGRVAIATDTPARFTLGEAGLDGTVSLMLGEGRARLEAAPSRLYFELEAAPAQLISNLTGGAPLDGSIAGEARFTRADAIWTGAARLELLGLRPEELEDADALSLCAQAALSREGWRLNAVSEASGLSGTADLLLSTGPVASLARAFPGDAPLEGALETRGQIATLAAFRLPETLQLAGRLRADAELSGTLSHPEVAGRAVLTSGRLRDQQTGLDLRVIDARGELAGERFEITRVTAQDGAGGHFRGSGRADWSDGLNARFDGAFDRFRLVNHPDRTAVGGGTVATILEDGRLRIEGDLVFDRAELRPSAAGRPAIPQIEVVEVNAPARNRRGGGPGAGLTPELDLHVSAPGRLFVRGSQFDTEWGLDLEVTGATDAPRLRGDATLLRGRAFLVGRDFTLERGVVRFNGAPEDAALDLAATRDTIGLSARVLVTGRVNAPEIRLASTPSLPEDEIAARLLFNRGVGSLSGLEAAQLAAALASLSGGFDPFAAVRAATGLDQFAFASNAEGETVVSGGRYLTDDVYLELETPTAGGAPRTSIEWSLSDRYTLRSSLGADGDASVSIGWRHEYD